MKKSLLYTTLIALCPLLVFAQAPDTLVARYFGEFVSKAFCIKTRR